MQKVITINLNGNAYQLDERGYEALVQYLEHADRQLAGNPDRAEILADLEQAIADKCVGALGAHKTVVSAAEIDEIIKQMGPVEGAPAAADGAGGGGSSTSGGAKSTSGAKSEGAPRRLYLIREGAMIAGVCNGLAAYLGVDVTIVRIVFVVVTLVTKGFGALAYGALMFILPKANTSEERAAAHGEPFNAQELIDRAKKQYGDFRNNASWKGQWRRQRREARRRARAAKRAAWWPTPAAPPPPPFGYATRIGAGLLVPLLSLASAVAFWLYAYAFVSLFARQEAFGESLPPDMPVWVGLLLLSLVYAAVAWPIHAMQRASYFAVGGYNQGFIAAWGGLLSAGFGLALVWFAYHEVPEVRELVQSLPLIWDGVRELSR